MPATTPATNLGIPALPTISAVPGGGSAIQSPIYGQSQMDLQNRIAQLGQARLEAGQPGFEPFAKQARQQFNRDTVPSIAERFTAQGGGQNSSAFANALGQSNSDLEAQLASAGAQYGLQNQQLGLQMAQLGLQPQYDQSYSPPSGWQGALGGELGKQVIPWGEKAFDYVSKAPGNGWKEKISSAFSGAAPVVAGVTAGSVLGSAATTAGTAAAGTALGTAATSLLPKTLSALGPSAAASAAPAAISALATKAGVGVAGTAASAAAVPVVSKAIMGSALPTLASVAAVAGPVGMIAAGIGLASWMAYQLFSND